jgi:hypothetical protein
MSFLPLPKNINDFKIGRGIKLRFREFRASA